MRGKLFLNKKSLPRTPFKKILGRMLTHPYVGDAARVFARQDM